MRNVMEKREVIIKPDDLILVTGAGGFIGARVVQALIARGFQNLRCFVRESNNLGMLEQLVERGRSVARVDVLIGDLLSRADCLMAAKDAAVVYHLAAGRAEKSFPDAFLHSVVTTRNLIEAILSGTSVRRFVSISSFLVYSNLGKGGTRLLDETCQIERHPERRGDAYSFAKVRQDELVIEYGRRFGLPYVLVRPGFVYGPGNEGISGRVGIAPFGAFLHLGGSNQVPFTYVDNCAEAIVLAGLREGVEKEVFNVVDDDLPTSREFLRLYKKNVRQFRSLYIPHWISYLICFLWEKYSSWSEGQIPPVYSRKSWHAYWKKTRYTNEKLKKRLDWTPLVTTEEGLARYFASCRRKLDQGVRDA